MKTVRLGLIGFGNVGQGFTQILRDFGQDYARKYGIQFTIVAISDARLGSVHAPDGLAPGALLVHVGRTGSLKGLAGEKPGWDALTLIRESGADAIVELSYTNLQTGEPATAHIAEALQSRQARGDHQ